MVGFYLEDQPLFKLYIKNDSPLKPDQKHPKNHPICSNKTHMNIPQWGWPGMIQNGRFLHKKKYHLGKISIIPKPELMGF